MRREPETNKKQRKISTMKPINNKQKKKNNTRYWTETWKLQEKNLSITLLGQWDRASLKWEQGLPWWCSSWEYACQCRGHRFEPWSGKIPHATEQLGPWATTTEPARLEPVLRNKRGRDGERPAHHDEEWTPLTATGESPHTETKTQHSQK